MPVIETVFENGMFRPLSPVDYSEGDHVFLKPIEGASSPESRLPTVREILSRRYNSGQTDTAARVDEHQP